MSRQISMLALVVAGLTATLALLMASTLSVGLLAPGFVLVSAVALRRPPLGVAVPVWGQLLAVALLVSPGGPTWLLLVPVLAGVVLSAELVGIAAAQGLPFARSPRPDLLRAGLRAAAAGGIFALIALVVGVLPVIPTPSGLTATLVAVGACVLLAVLFVRVGGHG